MNVPLELIYEIIKFQKNKYDVLQMFSLTSNNVKIN
jgi:hypothetical protein